VGYDKNRPVVLIPLQRNTGVGLMPPYRDGKGPFLEFFGGDDTDDNIIFSAPEYSNQIVEFLKTLGIHVFLAPLNIKYKTYDEANFYDNKYYINLENYKDSEEFLRNEWSKSSRKTILKQVRKIYREHEIRIMEDRYSDIDLLAEYNIKRFGKDSSFAFAYRKQIFKELIRKFNVVMLSIVVDGKTEAVSYGIKYKKIYVGMNAGVSGKIDDLSKLVILAQIDKAINLGCTVYDAGKGDNGWKESYKFSKIPQFSLSF
jgi:hypothetical protein